MEQKTILKMEGIEIAFPGVKALDKVDFCLRAGEVHALLGENGAGKSTLIKCLTGVHQMDAGKIMFDGREIRPQSPQEAMALGISTVYQEVNLCANLSVSENIFIGRQPMKHKRIDWKTINTRAAALLERFNLHIDVTRRLDSYSTAIQQIISIARAVDVEAKMLILDEPTSSLDEHEVKRLFRVLRSLRDEGLGIIFITHFLEQVFQISDRLTILRNGRLVGEFKTGSISRLELVTKMIGKDMDVIFNLRPPQLDEDAPTMLKAEHLGILGGVVQEISVELKKGELLGVAGLLGSGRTETAQMLFGVTKSHQGSIKKDGQPIHIKSPIDSICHGMAFCPEDRKKDGIIGELSVRENIMLVVQAKRGIFRPMSRQEQTELAEKYVKILGIATPDIDKKVGELSGGNQQKMILARWMASNPDVLILDEPTRGIDVGAKAEIQRLLIELCQQGVSVLFISSEL
ncbi:MAG: sugar ABC transporter ATP-binding protein, partial [Clostridiales bacterium]|nr:sugar ABC transporter ATP-binding protein [Clostridiales bacterium]